jgi:hypothetical protein
MLERFSPEFRERHIEARTPEVSSPSIRSSSAPSRASVRCICRPRSTATRQTAAAKGGQRAERKSKPPDATARLSRHCQPITLSVHNGVEIDEAARLSIARYDTTEFVNCTTRKFPKQRFECDLVIRCHRLVFFRVNYVHWQLRYALR